MNKTVDTTITDDDIKIRADDDGFNFNLVILGLIIIVIAIVVFRYGKCIKIVVQTFPRDMRGIFRLVKTAKALSFHQKKCHSVADIFEDVVQKHPSKVCIHFEGQEWTFEEIRNCSNQVANYFLNQGFRKGDVVGLFMENCPEYACIWLGLSKIGVVPALINSHVRLDPLKHSLEVANARGIIFGTELSEAIFEVLMKSDLNEDLSLYTVGSFKSSVNVMQESFPRQTKLLDVELRHCSTVVSLIIDKPTFSDELFYMYTSGTTGFPKAAIVKHARYIIGAVGVHNLNALRTNDVIYTSLPLYHTAGGIAALGQALLIGNTLVLRKKFSASEFWRDCKSQRVTVAQYIGETCRYLLSKEICPEEKQHEVRLMFGNGLRPGIWKEFVQRFNIPNISEAYGSTDGNCNMINFDGHVGAVGFVPIWAYKFSPTFLIQVDSFGEPVRSKNGLAIRCRPHEWGELVGKIDDNNPIREFKGYAGKDVGISQSKILRDVIVKGDCVFRTGDHLVLDDYGYFYFKDRVGDTFRWKGENVSTAEVESILSCICNLKDIVVYGVNISNTEGKAGMAAVASDQPLNLSSVVQGMVKSLPVYARPLFLRVTKIIDVTGTHKMKKLDLQRQGFDISQFSDPVYFFDGNNLVPLDSQLFAAIMEGKVRL